MGSWKDLAIGTELGQLEGLGNRYRAWAAWGTAGKDLAIGTELGQLEGLGNRYRAWTAGRTCL